MNARVFVVRCCVISMCVCVYHRSVYAWLKAILCDSTAVLVMAVVSGASLVGFGFLWVRVTIYSNAFGGAALLALGAVSFSLALVW